MFFKQNEAFQIRWKRGTDLPVAISAPQAVKIKDRIYVGGGIRMYGESCIYFTSGDTWTLLPICPTYQHALTAWDGKLIAIGGKEVAPTNKVYTNRDGVDKWEESLPPILTPRFDLSAITVNNETIIAAGGIVWTDNITGEVRRTAKVDVYTRASGFWCNTSRLPTPRSIFTMAVAGNTCYASGGVGLEKYASSTAFIDVPTLTSLQERRSKPRPLPWNQLPDDHPLFCSSLVEIDSNLVAMGGSAQAELGHGTRTISLYNTALRKWVECNKAQLPIPILRPGVVKFSENEVIVVGGELASQQFSAVVFIGDIN